MNRRRPDWILLVLMLSLAGCVSMDVAEPEIHVRHVPPTRADIIEAAIRLHDEPLNGHLWCDNLVSDAKPRTLGRYLASLISWQEPGGANWLEVNLLPRSAPVGKVWQATVMFVGGDGGEIGFGYGVHFLIRQQDGMVLSSSFVCPGTP